MTSFHGEPIDLVKDQTAKPSPTEYPPLLPTLQTWVGMVLDDGAPEMRGPITFSSDETRSENRDEASFLRSKCHGLPKQMTIEEQERVETNFQACALPITKPEILEYVRSGKRIATEQAVAMAIAYIARFESSSSVQLADDLDDFETSHKLVVDDLINDPGTVDMLYQTCMWREPHDFDLPGNSREVAILAKKGKIVRFLGLEHTIDLSDVTAFRDLLQTARRKRKKVDDSQHLVMPDELLDPATQNDQWNFGRSYRNGKQEPIKISDPVIVSKHHFTRIQRLLYSMRTPTDVTSKYAFDVREFIQSSGALSAPRLAALEASEDPYAIAYSFIAAQRLRQRKVVSDMGYARFLIKGEGALILQNRPDILTSFEDILVRRTTDLVALTAVHCPKGVRDHFSTEKEILARARSVCELMERYVKDFALDGKMENLIFKPGAAGGSGRGPVDFYNALCDELRDTSNRAKAANLKLDIGPVYKFLAKDILAWNNAWNDDAFAGGKVPGWVEYLARVRADEMDLDD